MEVATVTRGDLVAQLVTTGYVEARVTQTGFQLPGTIAALYAREGDSVTRGQLLAELEAAGLEAAVIQARAAVAAAQAKANAAAETAVLTGGRVAARKQEAAAHTRRGEANLQELEHGARREEIAQAEARVEQAAAALAQARVRVEAAATAWQAQRETTAAQVAGAEAELAAAKAFVQELETGHRPQEIEAARAALRKAQAEALQTRKEYQRLDRLFAAGAAPAQQREAAAAAREMADAGVTAALQRLDLLEKGPRPEERDRARARMHAAEAHLAQAEASRRLVELREHDREAASARVKQAEAALAEARQALALLRAGARTEKRAAAAAVVDEAQAGQRLAQAAMREVQVAQANRQAADALLEQATAALEVARAQYEKTRLRAPFTGVIARKHREVGDSVAPGLPVFTLVNPRKRWVTAELDDEDLGRIAVGQRVDLTLEAYPGEAIPGRVVRIGPLAQDKEELLSKTKIIRCRVEVDDPEERLKPGLEVDLTGRKVVKRNAVLVPNNALVRVRRHKYVFVLQGRRVHRREVKLGPSSYEQTVVVSGVRPGDRVVTVGKEGLAEGSRVRVVVRGEEAE